MIKALHRNLKSKGSSIFYRMLFSFVFLITLSLFVISAASFITTVQVLEDQQLEYDIKLLKLVGERMDGTVNSLNQVSFLAYDSSILDLLRKESFSAVDRALWEYQFREMYIRLIGLRDIPLEISSIVLLEEGKIRTSIGQKPFPGMDDYSYSDWYNVAVELGGKGYFTGNEDFSSHDSFSVARRINYSSDPEDFGVLVVSVPISEILKLFDDLELNEAQQVYVFSDDNRTVFQLAGEKDSLSIREMIETKPFVNKEDFIFTGYLTDKEEKIITLYHSDSTSLRYVTTIEMQLIHSRMNEVRISFLLIGMAVILFSIIAVALISRSLTSKIAYIDGHIGNIDSVDSLTPIPIEGNDEIARLAYTFNRMLTRINRLIDTVYISEIKEKEASLNALQSQINPHFLYNTLDTISAMSRLGATDQIGKLVISLSDLFKYGIDQKQKFVSLADELTHLNYYIYIQKTRFEERINFIIDVPDNLMNCKTIKLVIQPLVENAIHHGIEQKENGGEVVIEGRLQSGSLVIRIIDDGVGIEEQRFSMIKQALADPSIWDYETGKGKGIGLLNVHERLQLAFGNEAGLDIERNIGEGTIVSLKIPYMPFGEEDV